MCGSRGQVRDVVVLSLEWLVESATMYRWVVVVLAAAAASGSGAAGESFLSNISRNLRSEMSGVMEMANVSYSEPVINATYVATVEFDMRAMGSLYNSTHLVIDFIANKQAYPKGKVYYTSTKGNQCHSYVASCWTKDWSVSVLGTLVNYLNQIWG